MLWISQVFVFDLQRRFRNRRSGARRRFHCRYLSKRLLLQQTIISGVFRLINQGLIFMFLLVALRYVVASIKLSLCHFIWQKISLTFLSLSLSLSLSPTPACLFLSPSCARVNPCPRRRGLVHNSQAGLRGLATLVRQFTCRWLMVSSIICLLRLLSSIKALCKPLFYRCLRQSRACVRTTC